ncbi:hypothetical protein Fmac_015952 [Flemingia macrophylla]|uniref:Uncharacterized protein n=1 Tax=Flemingia macrophylla TaxID=520843 RepID=A0ABD1MG04_9FABA
MDPILALDTNIYNSWRAYGQSKLANILHASELARRLQGAATTCYVALHPQVSGISGKYFVDSNLAEAYPPGNDMILAKKLWDFSINLTNGFFLRFHVGEIDSTGGNGMLEGGLIQELPKPPFFSFSLLPPYPPTPPHLPPSSSSLIFLPPSLTCAPPPSSHLPPPRRSRYRATSPPPSREQPSSPTCAPPPSSHLPPPLPRATPNLPRATPNPRKPPLPRDRLKPTPPKPCASSVLPRPPARRVTFHPPPPASRPIPHPPPLHRASPGSSLLPSKPNALRGSCRAMGFALYHPNRVVGSLKHVGRTHAPMELHPNRVVHLHQRPHWTALAQVLCASSPARFSILSFVRHL